MCVNSLRFSIYKIMSPKLEMVYFFPISIPLIFRAKLPKPETPGKCWKLTTHTRVLFLTLEENIQLCTNRYDVRCGFFIDGLHWVQEVPFYAELVECCIMKGCLIFPNVCSAFLEISLSILPFINMIYYTEWFLHVKPTVCT